MAQASLLHHVLDNDNMVSRLVDVGTLLIEHSIENPNEKKNTTRVESTGLREHACIIRLQVRHQREQLFWIAPGGVAGWMCERAELKIESLDETTYQHC